MHPVPADGGHIRDLDLGIETPPSELSAVCSHEQWEELYQRLGDLIASHRSTLVFVNTRRLAERAGHQLRQMLGEDAVASHHGSLSREIRLDAEQRLKNGQLKAIVATASLEMGIDIGYIDLVCQLGSPRAIATFLQRVGRSGHSIGALPKGRLFPLTRDELMECMAVVRAVQNRQLDTIEIPIAPLDILAQQIVAAVACDDWDESDLYELCRRSWSYRELPRSDFDAIVEMLSEGVTKTSKRGSYLHRDRIHNKLRARRGARLAAVTSGGAIPDTAEYRVVVDPDGTFVGTLDEDFAIESLAGDVFVLGNTSWRVKHVRAGEVVVTDAEGAPPSMPFWLGEGPGRTIELCHEISRLRQDIADWQAQGLSKLEVVSRLKEQCGVNQHAGEQAADYVASQVAAIGLVPTVERIVFERFFDESGGMQLVIHAPLGQRINRAWGMSLRKRFCRSFDFELQAAATDEGLILSLSPQHSFPIESLFKMLGPHNGRHLLEQAALAQPMFQVRWRWNITRSLVVLRHQSGKRVPPHMLRFRSDDVLAAAFPETVGCLENHHGDVEIPDHPLVRQTMYDCLHEAMDVDRWMGVLQDVKDNRVELIARDTREPSPFCYEILNAYPYAFLDDAPLEERRTRAVSTRRSFSAEEIRDLASLDPDAIKQVREEAWPVVRTAEELHDALMSLVVITELEGVPWKPWLDEMVPQGRAAMVRCLGGRNLWIAAERWPLVRSLYPQAVCNPVLSLPAALDTEMDSTVAIVELIRGRIAVRGPVTAGTLASELGLVESQVAAALEAIESSGAVLRGNFTVATRTAGNGAPSGQAKPELQWCDRRLLSRIHKLTLAGLRQRIKPVSPADYVRFLAQHHRLGGTHQWRGVAGVREVIGILQGFEAPAGAWEKQLLATRIADYDGGLLDQAFLSGEVMWGRLRLPRRDDETRKSIAALTRVVPISVLLREDLSWLVGTEREPQDGWLRGNATKVLDALTKRGALFFQELRVAADLLPTHLDEALRELAACGLVTCDGFGAIRAFASSKQAQRYRELSAAAAPAALHSGRWSKFPGEFAVGVSAEQRLERWCQQLIRRYGVVFKEILTRESSAPSWHELVPVFRRMELKGEIRGGRFVSDVGGEQFAAENSIELLRQVRESPVDHSWLLVSACDPLNLSGILGQGVRVPCIQRNAIILYQGRFVAAKQAGQVEFFETLSTELQGEMRRALQTGRRATTIHIKDAWLKAAERPDEPRRPRSLLDAAPRSVRMGP